MRRAKNGDQFFDEPALQLEDFMQTSRDDRGMINILAADMLIRSQRVYSTFLLWLLSELFENLPELGDPEQRVLVRPPHSRMGRKIFRGLLGSLLK